MPEKSPEAPERQQEARDCLEHWGDLWKGCMAWGEAYGSISFNDWLDLLGREWVDKWLDDPGACK
jgi:hypothetical protein